MTTRYFIELAYNGSAYHGWQNQPNGLTVQEVLEKALTLILGEPIAVTGCGRTDAGVHARYFVAHFDASKTVTDVNRLVNKLNSYLPNDIAIFSITPVDDNLHARFDAISRSYEYHITTLKSPFLNGLSWRPTFEPDFDAMNNAAKILLHHTDFESFSKSKTDVKTFNCTITRAEWVMQKPGHWVFHITADRFLRNMVRAIVGTLLEVGRGRSGTEKFEEVILSKSRKSAGMSVPGEALFLTDVCYPPEKFRKQGR